MNFTGHASHILSASEMTIMSGGALNSTHTLNRALVHR